jgi:hypothetical protein
VKQLLALFVAFALALVPAAASAAPWTCPVKCDQVMQSMRVKGAAFTPAAPCCKHKTCMALCVSAGEIAVAPAKLVWTASMMTQSARWSMPISSDWLSATLGAEKPPPKRVA